MEGFFDTLLSQLATWSTQELLAVVFAIAYLMLAIRESIWCWICAGISTALYIWIFASAKLYMESALNIFYFAMAIYGWIVWRGGEFDQGRRPISIWPLRLHLIALVCIAVLVVSSGYLLAEYTDAAWPFIDSATTFSAIWATFLVARKVLENWWYWLVIDVVSIFIYWSRGLEVTSLLFVLYVLMIPFGLINWTRSYRASRAAGSA